MAEANVPEGWWVVNPARYDELKAAEASVMRIRDHYGLSDQSGCWIERGAASPDDECIACVIAAIIDRRHDV